MPLRMQKLTRRIGLLRALITTRLEDCESVDNYINKIITTAHKLNGLNFEMKDKCIGTFLLAGLPEEFKPRIMGSENSRIPITADSIKTKLLQDISTACVTKSTDIDTALISRVNKPANF